MPIKRAISLIEGMKKYQLYGSEDFKEGWQKACDAALQKLKFAKMEDEMKKEKRFEAGKSRDLSGKKPACPCGNRTLLFLPTD